MSVIDDRTPRTNAGSTWLRAGAIAAAASVVGNLAVLGVADLADASLVVTDGGTTHEITAGGVVGASLVPVVAGVVIAALIAVRWVGVVRLAQVVGGAFALLSVGGPLAADTDGGTSIALAVMHVVTGAAFVRHRPRRRAVGGGACGGVLFVSRAAPVERWPVTVSGDRLVRLQQPAGRTPAGAVRRRSATTGRFGSHATDPPICCRRTTSAWTCSHGVRAFVFSLVGRGMGQLRSNTCTGGSRRRMYGGWTRRSMPSRRSTPPVSTMR
jgi:hypothetical protein